ncbi:MAG: tetratricopeptide repeat protein [Balneolaceae bacterium]|nr:tetratricopeptide repeat protein [Balneolaceae bacterium]
MKTIQSVFFSFLVLMMAGTTIAQVPELIKNEQFRQDAQAAVDSLYNFNANGADQKLNPWKEKYPSHPLWQLMEGMEFWWVLLSDLHDTSRDDYFYEMMKKADYAASKLLYEQPGHADALIIRTVANGYIARQYSNRDEWTTSLNAARKAYNAYSYLKDNVPDLPDLKLAEGLKLYYSAYLPEEYPVVKTVSWFLPNGDKPSGLKYMRDASETAIFARAEATYFLGNINYNYEKNYQKAVGYFQTLYEQYPNNNYYARLLVKNLFKTNRYNEARSVIDKALKRWEQENLAFRKVLREELLFWKGRILLRKDKYEEARSLFEESLAYSKNLPRTRHRNYYPAVAYYAGLAASRMGDKENAAKFFATTLDAKTGEPYKKLAKEKMKGMRTNR